MLHFIASMGKLDCAMLAQVYYESLLISGRETYPYLPEGQQLQQAEQDFFAYLREDFFPTGGRYAVWIVDCQYVSALRLVPYQDGLLIAGLETAPDARNKGYARALMREVQKSLAHCATLYSHVDKKNTASLAVHQACGFWILSDTARLLDGSVSHKVYTMLCK